MVYRPRTKEQIYESLRDGLTNRISGLTNFVKTSFNYIWTQAFSRRFRDNEVALLATQMSGWIDYAGGPVTQEQLDALGLSNVTPEEVNQYMRDEDLDNLVEIVGVERDPGEEATGTVIFNTVSSFTEIPAGTEVATQPDGNGNYLSYVTDNRVTTASGETSVSSVNITAVNIGEEYNVGSGRVTYLPSPPTGVQSVSNASAILGGSNIESNEDLRARAKNAIFNKSGGGTTAGVRGYVLSNTDDVTTVSVAEYPGGNNSLAADSPSPGGPGGATSTTPFADVIVEGGTQSEILDTIEEARPVAIQHNLVRPTLVEVNVSILVEGSGIETTDVENAVTKYINSLDLGESVYRDKIIQIALNADSQVSNIDSLTVEITNESILYSSGTSIYRLGKGEQMVADGINQVTGQLTGTSTSFDEGVDYDEIDDSGDGDDDAINWGIGGNSPDADTDFFVTYEVREDIPIEQYEKGDTNSVAVTVV